MLQQQTSEAHQKTAPSQGPGPSGTQRKWKGADGSVQSASKRGKESTLAVDKGVTTSARRVTQSTGMYDESYLSFDDSDSADGGAPSGRGRRRRADRKRAGHRASRGLSGKERRILHDSSKRTLGQMLRSGEDSSLHLESLVLSEAGGRGKVREHDHNYAHKSSPETASKRIDNAVVLKRERVASASSVRKEALERMDEVVDLVASDSCEVVDLVDQPLDPTDRMDRSIDHVLQRAMVGFPSFHTLFFCSCFWLTFYLCSFSDWWRISFPLLLVSAFRFSSVAHPYVQVSWRASAKLLHMQAPCSLIMIAWQAYCSASLHLVHSVISFYMYMYIHLFPNPQCFSFPNIVKCI